MEEYEEYEEYEGYEEYEEGYEERYTCEYCGEGFMEGAYNNLICDICAIEHGHLD